MSLRVKAAVSKPKKDQQSLPLIVKQPSLIAEESSSSSSTGGTATIPNEIFNLVKTIIGTTVLSLPAGVASFGNAKSALIPATIIIAVIGACSAYTFSLIGRVCSSTGTHSFAAAWDKTMGSRSAWVIAASEGLNCFATNVAFSMVLADTFRDLLYSLGVPGVTRSTALLSLTTVVLLPLCLVKNLSSLAPFSLLGTLGILYTSLVIGIRYFGGAYADPNGHFLPDLQADLRPSFGTTGASGIFSPKALIMISMVSQAFVAHFLAPKFYNELYNNTIPRFNTVVTCSFGISFLVYAAVSMLGFLTFGAASSGLILNNYSTRDGLIGLSRSAVAVSIVFSYPLMFVGARDGFLDLFRVSDERRSNLLLNAFSVFTLSIITVLALHVKELTFVASMNGSTFGMALAFVYPCLMFRAALKKIEKDGKMTQQLVWENRLCAAIATMGVAVGAVGAKMAFNTLHQSRTTSSQ